jgi:hypothetical protein
MGDNNGGMEAMEVLGIILEVLGGTLVAVITGLFTREVKHNRKTHEEMEKRAEVRAKESYLSMTLMSASVALGVANSHAIQNGRANGDMEQALTEANAAIRAYRDFAGEVAAKTINQ